MYESLKRQSLISGRNSCGYLQPDLAGELCPVRYLTELSAPVRRELRSTSPPEGGGHRNEAQSGGLRIKFGPGYWKHEEARGGKCLV